MTRQPTRLALISAFGAVYVFWGGTYIGIHFAIETLPPLLMAGVRFAVAGAVFLLIGRLRDGSRPAPAEWRGAAVTGALLIGIGNGGVTWAEQTVPSGIAAIVASLVPLWMTLMDWARPGGSRPAATTIAGLVLGIAGLAVLVGGGPGGAQVGGGGSTPGMVVLILATIGWAFGSVLASYVRLPRSPVTAIGAQMTVGGLALIAAGLVAGEAPTFDWRGVSTRSLLAWGYLVVFGSWIGFSAYVWLLRSTTPAKVSTYAFVNPLVALALGVWLAAEELNARTVAAIAIILTGVVLIVANRGRDRMSGSAAEPGHDAPLPAHPPASRRRAS